MCDAPASPSRTPPGAARRRRRPRRAGRRRAARRARPGAGSPARAAAPATPRLVRRAARTTGTRSRSARLGRRLVDDRGWAATAVVGRACSPAGRSSSAPRSPSTAQPSASSDGELTRPRPSRPRGPPSCGCWRRQLIARIAAELGAGVVTPAARARARPARAGGTGPDASAAAARATPTAERPIRARARLSAQRAKRRPSGCTPRASPGLRRRDHSMALP